jgi:hypothetical protein
MPESERAEFAARAEELARSHPRLAADQPIDVPFACRCWRTDAILPTARA